MSKIVINILLAVIFIMILQIMMLKIVSGNTFKHDIKKYNIICNLQFPLNIIKWEKENNLNMDEFLMRIITFKHLYKESSDMSKDNNNQHICTINGGWTYSFSYIFYIITVLDILISTLVLYSCSCVQWNTHNNGYDQVDLIVEMSEEYISKIIKPYRYQAINSINNQISCCVCLEEYTEYEQLASLSCSHIFHKECIVEWLSIKQVCPMCKAPPTSVI